MRLWHVSAQAGGGGKVPPPDLLAQGRITPGPSGPRPGFFKACCIGLEPLFLPRVWSRREESGSHDAASLRPGWSSPASHLRHTLVGWAQAAPPARSSSRAENDGNRGIPWLAGYCPKSLNNSGHADLRCRCKEGDRCGKQLDVIRCVVNNNVM